MAPDPGSRTRDRVAAGLADPARAPAPAGAGVAPSPTRPPGLRPDLAGVLRGTRHRGGGQAHPGRGRLAGPSLRQTCGTRGQVGRRAAVRQRRRLHRAGGVASFAFTLPFDLAHEETRATSRSWTSTAPTLMRRLQVGRHADRRAIAAEWLGLSDAQRQLTITPAPAGQTAIWNTPATPASATLSNVEAFVDSRRHRVRRSDSSWSTSPGSTTGRTSFIRPLDASCDLAQKEIVNLDDAALDRLHRFLRLRARDRLAVGDARPGHPSADGRGWQPGRRLPGPAGSASTSVLGARRRRQRRARPARPAGPDRAGGATPHVPRHRARSGRRCRVRTGDPRRQRGGRDLTPGSGVKLSAHLAFLATGLGVTVADRPGCWRSLVGDPALTAASVSRAYAGIRLARPLRLPARRSAGPAELIGGDPLGLC